MYYNFNLHKNAFKKNVIYLKRKRILVGAYLKSN